jgi:hypothetical protein
VYWKSAHVMGTPSDQIASGLMWYVMVSTGVPMNSGIPVVIESRMA